MTRRGALLDRMRANPAGDWRIGEVETVCREYGITCSPPTRGDHFKLSHPALAEILTIPARRPIKPVYIRKLARFVEDVLSESR